jgi:hypothetical protein
MMAESSPEGEITLFTRGFVSIAGGCRLATLLNVTGKFWKDPLFPLSPLEAFFFFFIGGG